MKHAPPDPASSERSVSDAEATLVRLGGEIEAMKAVLVRLLQDAAEAEQRVERSHATQRIEASTALQEPSDTGNATMMDALTGLPMRAGLLDRFAHAVAEVRRHGGRCALLFVDLDDLERLAAMVAADGLVHGSRPLPSAAKRIAVGRR